MKKMVMVLMMVFGLSAVFAYEPKKECAKVRRNGNVEYYEKTEPYEYLSRNKDYENCIKWVIREGHTVDTYECGDVYSTLERLRKGCTVDQFVDYTYLLLESFREVYYSDMEKATNPEPDDFDIAMTELFNEMNGTNISSEEYISSIYSEAAESNITLVVNHLAFVTEENYLTLTKEELYEKVNDFIEEVKAENR